MMTTVPYWHVDAFSDRPFAGNPAAVMVFDTWPADPVLQAMAEENNFAETAFLIPDAGGAADWELRWFTPACEIRLCGHATLASGHILLGREPRRDRVTFRTRLSGLLEVHRDGTGSRLALPAIRTQPSTWPEAIAALGGPEPLEVHRNPDGYTIVLFESEAQVRALAPDFRALGALGDDLFICTAPGGGTDVVSRVFVPGAGVDEDPVTGAAHAVLTPFWTARLGRDDFSAFQASARGGHVACRIDGDRVWLGGPCCTVVTGTFAF